MAVSDESEGESEDEDEGQFGSSQRGGKLLFANKEGAP